MADYPSVGRRDFLGFVGSCSIAGIAGCNQPSTDNQRSDSSSSTETETIVFTDSQTATPTGSTEPTSPSPSTTATTGNPEVTYNGGDIQALRDALVTCRQNPGSTLRIEPGTYYFDPIATEGAAPHLQITDLEDISIEGNGAKFVFTDPLRGTIYFFGGDNLTIEDLTFDYDPVPLTQGEITDLSEDSLRVTINLERGYPLLDREVFQRAKIVAGLIHNPDGSFISKIRQRGSAVKRFESVRRLSGRRFELELSTEPGQNSRGLQVGRRLTVIARGGLGLAHALNFVDIDGVTISDLDVHASPGFALQLALCGDPVVRNVRITPPPGSGRLLGSVADGIHCQNCRDGPVIRDCRLEMLGDDGVIVDEKMAIVSGRRDTRTIETAVPGGLVTIEPGDVLDVMSPKGRLKGYLPEVADVEYDSRSYAAPQVVRFAEPVPEWLRTGHYLSNRSTNSGDFTIRNNVVRNTIANSVRIGTGPGLIAGNELDGAMIHNIWLRCNTSGDFPPKRWVNDVTIKDNALRRAGLTYFAAPGTEAIELTHDASPDVTETGQPNHTIDIVDNEIGNTAAAGVSLADTVGLTLARNNLTAINQLDYDEGGYGFVFQNISEADITNNRVEEGSGAIDGFAHGEGTRGLRLGGNIFIIDGEEKPVTIDA